MILIDLTYIEFDDRNTALANISTSLLRIKNDISASIPGIQLAESGISPTQTDKLLCIRNGVKIKIEVNTTMRGVIESVTFQKANSSVSKEFDKFAAIQIVSNSELFGGKISLRLAGFIAPMKKNWNVR